ncbi:Dual specificity phosphatase [Cinnamomum micranthum f. kanehirae]|uniref:Dual specificity phosphatase n=1 Tax=Cinnamomum micranthum f. kanehirae TaxID=337451 RepID=A0A3S3MU52_9MAGN|nr:Dual specificity phosphatase [Cinnamomum micranthum f. kanehirae]
MTFPIFAVLWTVHCSRHLMRLGAVQGFWFSYFHSTDLLQFFCIPYKPIGLKITGEFDISVYSGKIIECNWDWEKQCWAFMRIRTDKATPNDLRTFNKVKRSIKDNITEEVVLTEIKEIVSLPMYADRINNDKKGHGRRR